MSESKQARQSRLEEWAKRQLMGLGYAIDAGFGIESASDDASFRRYFRGKVQTETFIFVDAPPDKEDNPGFIDVNARLGAAGVPVPRVFASDLNEGFLMLSDLGDQLLLPALQSSDLTRQTRLYEGAIKTLKVIQPADTSGLPVYDSNKLHEEMALFPDWFLTQQLSMSISDKNSELFARTATILVDEALGQPTVFVHRDYHARNLMPQPDGSLGVIDFQDAVRGPITYDLVSLLKDCYWELPRAVVIKLVDDFRLSQCPEVGEQDFLRWFDLMGFQRHLKCAGIFSRLNLRDGKPGYLGDIPLIMKYLVEVAELYPELAEFNQWLRGDIDSAMRRGLP